MPDTFRLVQCSVAALHSGCGGDGGVAATLCSSHSRFGVDGSSSSAAAATAAACPCWPPLLSVEESGGDLGSGVPEGHDAACGWLVPAAMGVAGIMCSGDGATCRADRAGCTGVRCAEQDARCAGEFASSADGSDPARPGPVLGLAPTSLLSSPSPQSSSAPLGFAGSCPPSSSLSTSSSSCCSVPKRDHAANLRSSASTQGSVPAASSSLSLPFAAGMTPPPSPLQIKLVLVLTVQCVSP
jgi:hypothetical protein